MDRGPSAGMAGLADVPAPDMASCDNLKKNILGVLFSPGPTATFLKTNVPLYLVFLQVAFFESPEQPHADAHGGQAFFLFPVFLCHCKEVFLGLPHADAHGRQAFCLYVVCVCLGVLKSLGQARGRHPLWKEAFCV